MPILGTILIFIPGLLLSYIIFTKTDIIKRTVYSIILAISILSILGTLLFLINQFDRIKTILSLGCLSLLFLLILILKNEQYKTNFNKDLWYLMFFSLIGTGWRLWFLKTIKNFGDAYVYASKFTGRTIPDLGFYTGMVIDHSSYVGSAAISQITSYLAFNNQFLNIFLITFIYLGFIYLVFSEFRSKKMAYLGIALMAIGPIEIFHNTLCLTSVAALSYISIFVLFLLFKSKDNRIFWPTLLLSIALMFSYYTASMVIILSSIGFIIALVVKNLLALRQTYFGPELKTKRFIKIFKKILADKKVRIFLLIVVIVASYTYVCSNMKVYTLHTSQDFSGTKDSALTVSELLTKIPTNYYKGPTFFRISAVGWQEIIFFLCGLSFIFYLVRKKDFSEDNFDILLCAIPLLIVSYGFFHVNLPTRIFNYFAFFALLALKIPKKYFKLFFVMSFIFILIAGFYVVKDKRIFFETSDKEIETALWVKNSLQGKIFSDQYFINQLILNGYYNVTGAADDDPSVHDLFYQQSPSKFLETIDDLKSWLEVDYIVLTKRMREQYILMLDTPQKPLINTELYETNLIKIYDNEDVRVYKTKSL